LTEPPGYSDQTAAQVAAEPGTQRENLITWLNDRKQATLGSHRSSQLPHRFRSSGSGQRAVAVKAVSAGVSAMPRRRCSMWWTAWSRSAATWLS
jgi:hypothetical protein